MVAALLVASLILASNNDRPRPRYTDRYCSKGPGGRSHRGLPCNTGAFFEFAPASGAGLPVAQDLCSAASSYLSAATTSWCTRGDGTASGGTTSVTTTQGSPVLTTQRICPNGPDCAALNVFRTPAVGDGYTESASVDRSASVTTGSSTDCTWFNFAPVATEQEWGACSTNNTGTIRYMLFTGAGTDKFSAYVSNGACGSGAATVTGTISMAAGSVHVGCVTWAASDGIWRLYLDGVADATSASFTTICGGGASSRFSVPGRWNSGALGLSPSYGSVLGSFHIDTTSGGSAQLSAGQLSAMADSVLARKPTGAKGETMTYARTGSRFCESSTPGTGSMIPANVPCISRNGFGSFTAITNQAQYHNALGTAPWATSAVGISAPTVTNNYGVGPAGVLDATRIQIPACPTVGHSSAVHQPITTAVTTQTASLYLKGTSSSGNALLWLYDSTAGNGLGTVCAFTSTAWSRCTVTRTPSGTGGDVGFGCYHEAAVTNNQDTGAADVLVWGAQVEASAFIHPVVPTANASATAGVDQGISVTLSSAVGPTMCLAASTQFVSTAVGVSETVSLGSSLATEASHFRNTDTSIGFIINGSFPSTAVSAMGTSVHRMLLKDTAGTRAAFWDTGAATAPSASMSSGQTALRIGARWDGSNPTEGWVSRVQADMNPERCTP